MTRRLRVAPLAALAAFASGCSLVAGLGDYAATPGTGAADAGLDAGLDADAAGVEASDLDGGDAGPAACDASTSGVPVTLRHSVLPLHLDVHPLTGDVYWTEVGAGTPAVGSIARASPCSTGDYEVLQTGVALPATDVDVTKPTTTVGAIAVDAGHVYWTSGAKIQRAALTPGAGAETYEDQTGPNTWIEAIAIVGPRLCWIEQVVDKNIAVWSVDTSSPPGTAPTLLNPNLADVTAFYGLATTPAGYLFAATESKVFASGSPDTSGTLGQIASTLGAQALGGAGSFAYFATTGAFIYAIDANSTANGPNALVGNQRSVLGITTLGAELAWTVGAGLSTSPPGGLASSALDGGSPRTFVTGQNNPADVRVAAGNVYWLNRGDQGVGNGAVMRLGL